MKTQRTVARCTLLSRPECPRSWDALTPTGADDVRRCRACGDDVYFVRTDEDTIAHAEMGHCVAREVPDPSELEERRMVIGRPSRVAPEPAASAEQLRAAAWVERKRGIARAITPSALSGRRCAACGYPTPTYRERCYVCRAPT